MFGEKPYAERIKESRKECLSFALITREGKEMLLSLDEKQIDDLDYLKAQFSSLDWLDEESACFSALNPIRAAFKKLNFVNEN